MDGCDSSAEVAQLGGRVPWPASGWIVGTVREEPAGFGQGGAQGGEGADEQPGPGRVRGQVQAGSAPGAGQPAGRWSTASDQRLAAVDFAEI